MFKEWLLVGMEFGVSAFAAVLIFAVLMVLVLAVVGGFAAIMNGVHNEEDEANGVHRD